MTHITSTLTCTSEHLKKGTIYMHIVCSSCMTTNNIPAEKQLSTALCGKCKSAIYNAKPVTLTDQNFFNYIERNDLPIIVDFWADWCGPCQSFAPIFATTAEESDGLLFAKVNTQEAQQIGAEAGIRSIPTLMFFHAGEEIDRISGALSSPQLKQWIMQCIGKLT